MTQDGNRGRRFLLLGLVGALIGGAVAGVFTLQLMNQGGQFPGTPGFDQKQIKEMQETLRGLERELKYLREEQNQTRIALARLETKETKAGCDLDQVFRGALPPPYVKMVDDFFNTEAARSLLSLENQKKRPLKFKSPEFLSPTLIMVPYQLAGEEHFLIVSMKPIEYHEIRFDVLWDSAAGAE